MVELFQTSKQNISLHIRNCFAEGELSTESTVKEYLTVQREGKRSVERMVDHYNLDVIISVGYRVKSIRGTQFRIWANRILKEHLVQGYTVNEKRLLEQRGQIEKLRQSIALVERTLQERITDIEDARAVINLLSSFARGLQILDDYNHENLEQTGKTQKTAALFLYFLDKNDLLYNQTGLRRLSDDGLAALTLLIAVSRPEEMNTMIKIVITVLNRGLS